MKRIFQSKSFLRKMAIIILVVLLCYCIVPTYTYAGFGGDILKVVLQLLVSLGDVVTGLFNHYMLGTDALVNSVMLERDSGTVRDPRGALHLDDNAEIDLTLNQSQDIAGNTGDNNEEALEGGLFGWSEWKVPNLLYSPEAIFANRVAALDVNFLSPNQYTVVQYDSTSAEEAAESAATSLQVTISNWYVGFRNLAVVALLVVLVYLGIKILIGSVSEKAKYKEAVADWFLALCLVFIIHFIMSGILMVTQKVTELFEPSSSEINVAVVADSDGDAQFKQSLMGVARLRAQSKNVGVATAFCLIYLVLVFYTGVFTFIYFKRLLYMAFLTMIAPLVAITYPIDRMGDGQAQAFNMWFKEYMMNALIQPIHLILYTALVSSANDLVVKNPIYAIVAIAFLIPAEKFIKDMFGLNKATTPGNFGGFAAGALTMNAASKVGKVLTSKVAQNNKQDKVRTADNNAGSGNYLDENSGFSGLDSGGFNSYGGSNNDILNSGNDNNGSNPGGGSGLGINNRISGLDGGANPRMNPLNNGVNPLNSGVNPLNGGENPLNSGINPLNGGTNDISTRRGRAKQFVGKAVSGAKKIGNTGGRVAKIGGKLALKATAKTAKGVWRNKKQIAKVGLSTAGAVLGAGVGLAAGLSTGDPSKIVSSMIAGGTAGNMIGSGAVNAVSGLYSGAVGTKDMVSSGFDKVKYGYDEVVHGQGEAERNKEKREKTKNYKRFLKDEEQIKQAKKIQAQLAKQGQQEDLKNIMKSRYDYVSAGIDEADIQRAQLAEARTGMMGDTHKDFVNVAKEASNLGINKSTFTDSKKYSELMSSLSGKLGEEEAKKAMGVMAEIKGSSADHKNQLKKIENEKLKRAQEQAEALERIRMYGL